MAGKETHKIPKCGLRGIGNMEGGEKELGPCRFACGGRKDFGGVEHECYLWNVTVTTEYGASKLIKFPWGRGCGTK